MTSNRSWCWGEVAAALCLPVGFPIPFRCSNFYQVRWRGTCQRTCQLEERLKILEEYTASVVNKLRFTCSFLEWYETKKKFCRSQFLSNSIFNGKFKGNQIQYWLRVKVFATCLHRTIMVGINTLLWCNDPHEMIKDDENNYGPLYDHWSGWNSGMGTPFRKKHLNIRIGIELISPSPICSRSVCFITFRGQFKGKLCFILFWQNDLSPMVRTKSPFFPQITLRSCPYHSLLP